MPNYRGGDAGQSEYGRALTKAIAEGRTERQQERDFRNRAIMTAVQAGLTGLSGVMSAQHSKNLQKKADQDKIDALASQADAMPTRWERKYDGSEMPSWMHQGVTAQGAATDALRNNAVNDAAQYVTKGGYQTKVGGDNQTAESDMVARDTATGMGGIAAGRGMQQSYPTQGVINVPTQVISDEDY